MLGGLAIITAALTMASVACSNSEGAKRHRIGARLRSRRPSAANPPRQVRAVAAAGGHIEPDETPRRGHAAGSARRNWAQSRIVTGPVFRHPAVTSHVPPFAIMEMAVTDPVSGPHRHVDFVYVCRAAGSDDMRHDTGEVSAARWAALADLGSLNVPPELPELTVRAMAWADTSDC